MPHSLQQKLATLRSRVRRLVLLYGVSWTIAAGLAAAMVAGLADAWIHFEDQGLRVLATLCVLGTAGWTAYHRLYRTFSMPLGDVVLARRVQRRFPDLGDGLASAVEFLGQSEGDYRAGSISLRRAVITQVAADTERLDFLDAAEDRPAVRAIAVAIAMAIVVLIAVAVAPRSAWIAVARLANPFAETPWPQVHHLVLRNPVERIARGQAFEAEVVEASAASLPMGTRIHYRLEGADGALVAESEPMHHVGDAMVARRENVQRSFWFRVEGGDDHSMSWQRVEVQEPPAVESVQVRLHPPAYTGWPEERGERNIHALAGTWVHIHATATRPLASAVLCLGDGRQIPGVVRDDGMGFGVGETPGSFVIEKSGDYWFRLVDEEGLSGGEDPRWEIRVVPDDPPSVAIEQPAADIFVTPQAVVPIHIAARDTLALQRIDLEYTFPATAAPAAKPTPAKENPPAGPEKPAAGPRQHPPELRPAGTIGLYRGPQRVGPRPQGLATGKEPGESVRATHAWKLAELGLRPGTVVTIRGVAADYKPQIGRSEPRRLSIITPEELADRLASRQGTLLAELGRILQMQRQSREQVTAIEVQATTVGPLAQRDVDRLRGAELTQRQVAQSLTSRSDGVPSHIVALLADLSNNQIDSPDVQRRMQGILAEIDRLAATELPTAGRALTAAIKAAQVQLDAPSRPAQRPAVADPLAEGGKAQQRVIASLEQMLAELSRWDSFRRFHRVVGELIRAQQDLNRDSEQIGRRTLGKEPKDLSPQEAADLRVAGRRQVELSLRLDGVLQDMEGAAGPLRENDPLAAQAVSDALARARDVSLSGRMRTTGVDLEHNRAGEALAHQQQILEQLREVLDILANRREHELSRLIKKFQEAQDQVAQLGQREEGLRKQFQQAAAEAASKPADPEARGRQLERLTAQQKQLQQEAERMARMLERLTAQQAAQSAQKAAEQMGQAGQCGQGGQCGQAAEHAEQARKHLENAGQQLAQQRRQAEAELAGEQLARLDDALSGLHRRQAKALEETRRLEELRITQGRLTDGQQSSVGELAREQQSLHAQTAALAEKLAGAKVLHLALSAAAGEMAVAAGLLDRRDTAQPQKAQQQALDRLAQIQQALKPEPPAPKPAGAGGQGGKGGPPPAGPAIQAMAELKLLKLMQQDLNRRTQALDESLHGGKLTEDAARQYSRLSDEQGQLADLLLGLIPPQAETETDVPPELRPPDASKPPAKKDSP